MGHKVNPKGLRIGITTNWRSRWFDAKTYAKKLREDVEVRRAVMQRWKNAAIADVEIERSSGSLKLIIETSRPGVLIGRGGTGIEDISRFIKSNFFPGKKIDVKVEVKEVKNFEENASLVAQNVAEQIEKRMPYKRAMKAVIDQAIKNKNIKGIKVEVSGRLGGAEISRREWLAKGSLPLHTLRADIDFSRARANTTYGVIGVKVWLYRGEVFNQVKD